MMLMDMRLAIDRLLKYERQGSTVSPSDFNRFVRQAAREEFVSLKQAAELNNDVTHSLLPFIKEVSLTHAHGIVTLPDDYAKVLSVSLIYNGKYVSVDEVSAMEYDQFMGNSVLRATYRHPMYRLIGNNIVLTPIPVGSMVDITYISKYKEPYLDYYINKAQKVVYLSEGETVENATTVMDTEYLGYGDNGKPIELVGGSYVSKTSEMEFDDTSSVRIFHRVLTYCGLTIPDERVIANEEGKDS